MTQAKTAIKHSSIYAAGNLLRQLASFIMLPIYTQYLSPEDYGIVGLLTFALSLMEVLFGARLMSAVPKYYFSEKEQQEKNAIISTALFITITASVILTFFIANNKESASFLLLGSYDYAPIIALFSVLLITQAVENYGMGFLRIRQKPYTFVILSTLKLITQISLNVYFVIYLDLKVLGIAYAATISSCLFASGLLVYTIYKTGITFNKSIAKKMFIFCWPLWVGSLAALYTGSANRIFISTYTSLEEVGLFELAVKFSLIMTALIWKPFAQYWQIERFKIVEHNENHHEIFRVTSIAISTVLILVALGISIFSETLITIMATPEFHRAAIAVPILLVSGIFNSLCNLSNFGFLLKDKTSFISRNSYFTAVIATILYFTFIPEYGFVGAAIALMITRLIQFLIINHYSKRYYDIQFSLSIFFSQLIIAIACFLISDMFINLENIFLNIAAKFFFMILFYLVIISFTFKDKHVRDYGMSFIRQRILKTKT